MSIRGSSKDRKHVIEKVYRYKCVNELFANENSLIIVDFGIPAM